MKVSIIIPVLNSHEACKRHVRHFRSMRLPDTVEIIFVDDGSNPSLSFLRIYGLKNLIILPTNDKRPWTQGLARNVGAKIARGEYLFMTDIDHIISLESIMAVLNFRGDRMDFPREFGILDKRGVLKQDEKTLLAYGMNPDVYQLNGLKIQTCHGNTFAIKKDIFWELGGYNPRFCINQFHAPKRKGEDCYFNRRWQKALSAGKYKERVMGPRIFMFPIGRYHIKGENNPMGLFHTLSYEPVKQPMLD